MKLTSRQKNYHARMRAAAQHGVEAMMLLSTARELRHAAKRALLFDTNLAYRLRKDITKLDSRRRRIMAEPTSRTMDEVIANRDNY